MLAEVQPYLTSSWPLHIGPQTAKWRIGVGARSSTHRYGITGRTNRNAEGAGKKIPPMKTTTERKRNGLLARLRGEHEMKEGMNAARLSV